MTTFSNIYPFTTENISGYMNGIDFTDKRIITVTGSSDHIFNAINNGAKSVTSFDINPLTKYYLELKKSGIIELNFEMFVMVFLKLTRYSLDYEIIKKLSMSIESKRFWLDRLKEYDNKGIELRRSDLFHINYFNPLDELWINLYLEKKNYNRLKKKLNIIPISFINASLQDLNLEEHYDYMFLSNIGDYMDSVDEYLYLVKSYLEYVDTIYFAYLYDLGNNKTNGLYDIDGIRKKLGKIHVETFRSVFGPNKRDGVLILRKN